MPDEATRNAASSSGRHYDAELERPEHLPDERLVEIIRECLNRWDAYPTIPGSRRWARNGGVALTELSLRLQLGR